MALGAFVPGDENFDWTTIDSSQINGVLMNMRIQQPLIAAVAGMSNFGTYVASTGSNKSMGTANATATPTFDTVYWDSMGGWQSSAPSSVTITTDGFYLIIANLGLGLSNHSGSAPVAGTSWYWTQAYRSVGVVGPLGTVSQGIFRNAAGFNGTQQVSCVHCLAGNVIQQRFSATWDAYYGTQVASPPAQAETSLVVVKVGN